MGACTSAPLPVRSLHVFWDLENCNSGVSNATNAAQTHRNLMAWIGASAGEDLLQEVTSRGACQLSFYVPSRSSAAPKAGVAKALDTLGWRHVNVVSKLSASDFAIQRDVDALLTSAIPRRCVVVFISGDSDFSRYVIKCKAAGCTTLLVVGPASSETFRELVPATNRTAWKALAAPHAAPASANAATPQLNGAAATNAPPAPPAEEDLAKPRRKPKRTRARSRSRSEPPLISDGDSFWDARAPRAARRASEAPSEPPPPPSP